MATVLVLVDEPDTLLAARHRLEVAGHRVVLAADAEMALASVEADRPDAVVVDVTMPALDGWTVGEALARRPGSPPVLPLAKPFDPDGLVAAVDDLVSGGPHPGGRCR